MSGMQFKVVIMKAALAAPKQWVEALAMQVRMRKAHTIGELRE